MSQTLISLTVFILSCLRDHTDSYAKPHEQIGTCILTSDSRPNIVLKC